MSFRQNPRERLALGAYVIKCFCLVAPVAAAIGSACALFLRALERARVIRLGDSWLLFSLPVAVAGNSVRGCAGITGIKGDVCA